MSILPMRRLGASVASNDTGQARSSETRGDEYGLNVREILAIMANDGGEKAAGEGAGTAFRDPEPGREVPACTVKDDGESESAFAEAAQAIGYERSALADFPQLAQLVERQATEGRKLGRSERREAKRALKRDLKAARKAERAKSRELAAQDASMRHTYKSIASRLRADDRKQARADREVRARRRRARDVYGAIGFERMYASGLCEVEEGLFSETMSFTDVSYQSAIEATQYQTMAAIRRLFDSFDPSSSIQMTVANLPVKGDAGEREFFDETRLEGARRDLAHEYNEILRNKLLEGSSNLRRERFITYSTKAKSAEEAAASIARIRPDVRERLEGTRSRTHVLDGRERLDLINTMLRPTKPFVFDYERDLSSTSALTAKDFVCPEHLDFSPKGDGTCFVSDGIWCQVLVMRPNFASELSDRSIATICDAPVPLVVTWHLMPIDKARAVSMVKRQASWVQKEVVDVQRRAFAQGVDGRMLPPELKDMLTENEKVLHQIQFEGQRLYYFCGLAYTWGTTKEELDERVLAIVRAAHAEGIEFTSLDLRQREGLNSVLPLAHNHVDVIRDLTSTEAAILVPFTTSEIDMVQGGYYGQNHHSNNLVICNRKMLMSPHGFVCGMSGSGKSFAVKREIENTILGNPADEVYIMDVTGEYSFLVARNEGVELDFGPDAVCHANPLDMAHDTHLSRQAALAWKIDALLAMVSALKAEGGDSLTQEERSVVSAAAEATYQTCDEPILSDFVEALRSQTGPGEQEARRLALVLSRYVSGPMSFLNHASDIAVGTNNLTSFNTRDVPADMRCFCMLANLECVRQRMFANHERGVATWLYIDEVQSLFGHPAIINYLARLWREGRKYGLICTGMTQSAQAMEADEEASTIIAQSGFLLLLRQADGDRAFWTHNRNLSAMERDAIGENAKRGQGLLIADAVRVRITDDFPDDTMLYTTFSTSPEDYARQVEGIRNRDLGR